MVAGGLTIGAGGLTDTGGVMASPAVAVPVGVAVVAPVIAVGPADSLRGGFEAPPGATGSAGGAPCAHARPTSKTPKTHPSERRIPVLLFTTRMHRSRQACSAGARAAALSDEDWLAVGRLGLRAGHGAAHRVVVYVAGCDRRLQRAIGLQKGQVPARYQRLIRPAVSRQILR